MHGVGCSVVCGCRMSVMMYTVLMWCGCDISDGAEYWNLIHNVLVCSVVCGCCFCVDWFMDVMMY